MNLAFSIRKRRTIWDLQHVLGKGRRPLRVTNPAGTVHIVVNHLAYGVHLAAANGHIKVVQVLLDAEANMEFKFNSGLKRSGAVDLGHVLRAEGGGGILLHLSKQCDKITDTDLDHSESATFSSIFYEHNTIYSALNQTIVTTFAQCLICHISIK